MTKKTTFADKLRRVTPFGWLTKVYGALFFVFLGLLVLAHLIPGFEEHETARPTPNEAIRIAVFVVAIIGLGIGVLREYPGGLITVVTMLIWFYLELFSGPGAPKHLDGGYVFFYLVLLGGVLHILAGTRLGLRPQAPRRPADAD